MGPDRSLPAFGPPVHGSNAGAAHLNEAERLHDGDELLDLGNATGDLEDEMLGIRVDDAGAECICKAQSLDTGIPVSLDLDQRELALQRIVLIPLLSDL